MRDTFTAPLALEAAAAISSRFTTLMEGEAQSSSSQGPEEGPHPLIDTLVTRGRRLLELLDSSVDRLVDRLDVTPQLWASLSSLTWCPVLQTPPELGEGMD